MLRNPIIALPANIVGNDYVIGDLHGNDDCFFGVIDLAGPGDRIFVAGDLIDRGNNNLEILTRFLNQDAHTGPSLYAILGNHEQMCLDTIEALEIQLSSGYNKLYSNSMLASKLMIGAATNQTIRSHAYTNNGGRWLLNLFIDELKNGHISYNDDPDSAGVVYSAESMVGKIKTYFSNLPVIIHVEDKPGVPAFNLVHADMPFNDQELYRRLNLPKPQPDMMRVDDVDDVDKENLSDDMEDGYWVSDDEDKEDEYELMLESEIDYALWARANSSAFKFKSNGRTEHSVVTYTGHNIIYKDDNAAYRHDVNTCCLDSGACFSNISVVVNHTEGSMQLVVSDITASGEGEYYSIDLSDFGPDEDMSEYIVQELQSHNNFDEDSKYNLALEVVCLNNHLNKRKLLQQILSEPIYQYTKAQDWYNHIFASAREAARRGAGYGFSDLLQYLCNNKIIPLIMFSPLLDVINKELVDAEAKSQLRLFDTDMNLLSRQLNCSIFFLKDALAKHEVYLREHAENKFQM